MDNRSGGSSPFPPVGYIVGMWVECILPICEIVLPDNRGPVHSLNSAKASILGQSATSESATVYCFSFVRALSLHNWHSATLMASISPSTADLLCLAAGGAEEFIHGNAQLLLKQDQGLFFDKGTYRSASCN
ncbi:unnamed protein product [Rodentolepis nana]|uniref:Uncharacterized protein n=1 Tax=Rodentolepis nana TaxID=102285 RepID=A0A3P7TT93_RODNA|nr:unnamed protein product [Rodentolepis nana]